MRGLVAGLTEPGQTIINATSCRETGLRLTCRAGLSPGHGPLVMSSDLMIYSGNDLLSSSFIFLFAPGKYPFDAKTARPMKIIE